MIPYPEETAPDLTVPSLSCQETTVEDTCSINNVKSQNSSQVSLPNLDWDEQVCYKFYHNILLMNVWLTSQMPSMILSIGQTHSLASNKHCFRFVLFC